MRTDRIPGRVPGNHSLVSAQRGKNRFAPGKYRCKCGQSFTGLNAFEAHRAAERRNNKGKPCGNV